MANGVEYRYYEAVHDLAADFKPRLSMRVHIAAGESRVSLCGNPLRTRPGIDGYFIRYRALPAEPANDRLCRSCARIWNSREDPR